MTVRITKPEFNLREKLSELDRPIGLKGSELMRSDNVQDARELVGAGRKNMIINGDMRIAQKETTKTGIILQGYYTCDRWHIQLNGPTLKLEQDSDNPGYGFKNSLAITTTTAVSSIAGGNAIKLRYLIEGYDVAQLQYGTTHAKPFTLSFWVKSSLTGQFAISFSRDSRIVNRQVTVNSANTWEHKSITILGDVTTALGNTTNGTGMIINIFPSSGANSTDGASIRQWNSYHNAHTAFGANMGHLTVTNSTFKITGVQMEVGKVATEFEFRSRAEELALCQRYFFVMAPLDNYAGYGMGGAYSPTQAVAIVPFPVAMRAKPTFSYVGALGDFYDVGGGCSGGGAFSSMVVNNVMGTGTNGEAVSAKVHVVGSGTAGNPFMLATEGNTSTRLYFDAEIT